MIKERCDDAGIVSNRAQEYERMFCEITRPENIERFKAAYLHAELNKKQTFMFDGFAVYTPYAKYVVEYITMLENKQ
jgi:hypothetical protein